MPTCPKIFDTLIGYEEHYNTNHRYVCGTCHKRLPSPHFLDLHVSETHDSYFEALAERQPMVCFLFILYNFELISPVFMFQFQCFVESCSIKFSTKKERRSHCIEVHKFPPDFRYDSSKNEERKKKTATDSATAKHVPTKMLGFGHSSNRGLFRNRRGGLHQQWSKNKKSQAKNEETEVSMADLEEALPSME